MMHRSPSSIEEIKERFDLVEYAVAQWGGRPERSGAETRLVGAKLGGFEIRHDDRVFYHHAAGVGGDALDLVGYALHGPAYFADKGRHFADVVQEAARVVNLTPEDRPPMMPLVDHPPTDHHPPARNGHPSASERRRVALYRYTDAAGVLLFETLRYTPKGFSQRRPHDAGGWINGLTAGDYERRGNDWCRAKRPGSATRHFEGVPLTLYRLPELAGAIERGDTIYIVEGEKDADTLHERGLVATTNPLGAGKWREEYSRLLAGADVVILPDNDEAGREHARSVARSLAMVAASVKIVELPGLPDKGDVTDWIGNGCTVERLRELAQASPGIPTGDTGRHAAHAPIAHEEPYAECPPSTSPTPVHEDAPPRSAPPTLSPVHAAWEPPVPLPDGRPPVASLDVAMIPAPFRGWITDVAERMQIPPDFVAAPAMVIAGSLIGRRIGIYPKQKDDWLVIPNLWGAVVGRPSLLKTPAIAEAMRPLERLVERAQDVYGREEAHHQTVQIMNEAEKKALSAALQKAVKTDGDRTGFTRLAEKIQTLSAEASPTLRRYKTEDSTVEKIGELLRENPNGLLIHRDELSGWFRGLDKQGREGDRAFYLEGWNGTGSYTVDRIGRGTLHIPAVTLSILGGIQPGPLASYVYQATAGGVGDDGLLQRFQLLVWPDPPATWKNVDRSPDSEAQSRAYRVFEEIDRLDPLALGATPSDNGVPALRFAPDAQEIFDEWRTTLETELRLGGLTAALEAHLAKYRSLVPSLALIFHLCETIGGTVEPGAVGTEAVRQAIAWAAYLKTHAERLYSSAEAPEMQGARALLKRITEGNLTAPFTPRDVYRKGWSMLTTSGEVDGAVKLLVDYGWVRVEKVSTGGRPTEEIRTHPVLTPKHDCSEIPE